MEPEEVASSEELTAPDSPGPPHGTAPERQRRTTLLSLVPALECGTAVARAPATHRVAVLSTAEEGRVDLGAAWRLLLWTRGRWQWVGASAAGETGAQANRHDGRAVAGGGRPGCRGDRERVEGEGSCEVLVISLVSLEPQQQSTLRLPSFHSFTNPNASYMPALL